MREDYHWIHDCLDAELPGTGAGGEGAGAAEELNIYRSVLAVLEHSAEPAPTGFATRVMAAVPDLPARPWWRRLWEHFPFHWRWSAPALVGATVLVVLILGPFRQGGSPSADLVAVTFDFHAPGAQQVEIVGSFTDWQPERIKLKGPDRSGHWTTTVKLPTGLHEYLFLVDGSDWQTDPKADAFRPDGFGNENALLQI